MKLRVGRKLGRTIYVQSGEEPSDDDKLIGIMDTSEWAITLVKAFNFLEGTNVYGRSMTWVRVGNEHAIETFPNGKVEPLEGRRITILTIPDDRTIPVAVAEVMDALKKHIAEGESPSWIDSSSQPIRDLLLLNYGIDQIDEPEGWLEG